jgi:hypothetical protein
MTRLQGLGTVIKVSSGGLAQPVVRVRWDDGTLADYASGMSISRDAVSRNVHPHLDESVGPDTALARPLTHMYVACVRIPTTDFC